jgi:hypothetical protein
MTEQKLIDNGFDNIELLHEVALFMERNIIDEVLSGNAFLYKMLDATFWKETIDRNITSDEFKLLLKEDVFYSESDESKVFEFRNKLSRSDFLSIPECFSLYTRKELLSVYNYLKNNELKEAAKAIDEFCIPDINNLILSFL